MIDSLPITPDLVAIVFIVGYVGIAVLGGWWRFKSYLLDHPDEEQGRKYHQHNENIFLTFAGFSLTALALFISMNSGNLPEISSIVLLFSLAMIFFILAYIVLNFRIVNFAIYLADTFFNAGLLSIVFGFLIYFAQELTWYHGLTNLYVIFIAIILIALAVNFYFFDSLVNEPHGGEKKNE